MFQQAFDVHEKWSGLERYGKGSGPVRGRRSESLSPKVALEGSFGREIRAFVTSICMKTLHFGLLWISQIFS